MSGIKDAITKIAQAAALNAVNYNSSTVQSQLNSQKVPTGLMTVGAIDTSQNPTAIQVIDGNGNVQNIQYLGNDYPYIGQILFVDNGYVS